MGDKVGRVDCIYLRTPGASRGREEALMEEYCDDHFGKLHSLDPFDTLSETAWQWQKELLSHLGMSHREATTTFDFKANQSRSSRPLFSFESGSSKTRSSMKMVESCRGESLDSYQHLSSDGFAHSWLPSYSNLAKKYKEKGFPQHFYLVIMNSFSKWQNVFSCRAGRMVSLNRNEESGKRVLEPLKKQGILSLMYSADADSWCLQWKQNDCAEVQGLPPLVSKKEKKEDEFSMRFTGPSKVRFEPVACETGEILGVHLVSNLYKRQPAFFWLQEEFSWQNLGGALGLAKKMEDTVRGKGEVQSTSGKQPLLALGGPDKMQFETVLLNLMSSCYKTQSTYPQGATKREETGGACTSSANESKSQSGCEPEELEEKEETDLYSWTAQLDAELAEVERPDLTQIQTSHNVMAKAPQTAAAPQEKEEDTSLLFELD